MNVLLAIGSLALRRRERTLQDREDPASTDPYVIPMGNYVIDTLGNYVTAKRSDLGNFKIADTGQRLEAIATALPGGTAARNAPTLEATLNERRTGWAGEIFRWSDSVAAAVYAASDASATAAFG